MEIQYRGKCFAWLELLPLSVYSAEGRGGERGNEVGGVCRQGKESCGGGGGG